MIESAPTLRLRNGTALRRTVPASNLTCEPVTEPVGDYTFMWIASGWLTIRSVHTASRLCRTAPGRRFVVGVLNAVAPRIAQHVIEIRSAHRISALVSSARILAGIRPVAD